MQGSSSTPNSGAIIVVVGSPTLQYFFHEATAWSSYSPPSYNEEKAAMRMPLEWFLSPREATAIYTERNPLLKATQSGSVDTSDLRRLPENRCGKATLQGIPGHYVMAGNEEADACGMQTAPITDGAPRPVPFVEAAALIRRGLMGPPPT